MSSRIIRWLFWPIAVLLVIGTTFLVWHYSQQRRRNTEANAAAKKGHEAPPGDDGTDPLRPSEPVEVKAVNPRVGAMERVTTQAGTVEAYEVQLHAQVSGLLKPHLLNAKIVDIGTVVKKGEVVAAIDVPDLQQQFERNAAVVEQAKSRVKQMTAKVAIAKADLEASKAQIAYTEANAKAATTWVVYRGMVLDRMEYLAKKMAVEQPVYDEAKQHFEATRESENAAKAAVVTTRAQVMSAAAKVLLADADVGEAEAQVKVAEAELGKAKVQLDFARIKAPFDGIITQRNFYEGAFVRSAGERGAPQSLFTLQRTDVMRVVVQIPDRDVPYADPDDPAEVEIDAFPGKKFPAKVSLIAKAEDPRTRLMPVEIHLPNPDGVIRQGMYGRVTIILDKAAKQLSIPTACLVGRAGDGHGTVYVVRDGKPRRIAIKIGMDNGKRVEVLSGLTTKDEVILSPPASLTPDVEVFVTLVDETRQQEQR